MWMYRDETMIEMLSILVNMSEFNQYAHYISNQLSFLEKLIKCLVGSDSLLSWEYHAYLHSSSDFFGIYTSPPHYPHSLSININTINTANTTNMNTNNVNNNNNNNRGY